MTQAPQSPLAAAGDRASTNPVSEGASTSIRRVLLVGQAASLEPLRRWIGHVDAGVHVVGAADYLLALGLAPRVEPDVVVGSLEGLGEMRDSIISGFRRLSPKAQLAVVAPSQKREQAEQAVEAGMDRCLIEPLTSSDLARLLALPLPPEASPPVVNPDTPTSQPDPGRPDPLADPLGDMRTADAELGDVDLLDQLMRDPVGFTDMAVRLAKAQSGIEGLGFAPLPESSSPKGPVPAIPGVSEARLPGAPAGSLSVQVEYRGKALGLLHAPPSAGKQALESWATWLGHWLALEKKFSNLWEMAVKDELTGAYNRRYFDRYLARLLTRAAAQRSPVTLLAFDIDDFKSYNDRYGHAAGDEILLQTARLMRSVVREHDVVARIGGDEFAVIFWDAAGPRRPHSSHPDDVKKAAQRFQRAICNHRFPKLYDQAPGTLTISGGLASFPWDGSTPQALLERADAMLFHSKRQGKNAITFGPGAARACDVNGTGKPE